MENFYQKLKRSPMERHTQTHGNYTKYFDGHRHLSQLEESECMLTYNKDGVTKEFLKGTTRVL